MLARRDWRELGESISVSCLRVGKENEPEDCDDPRDWSSHRYQWKWLESCWWKRFIVVTPVNIYGVLMDLEIENHLGKLGSSGEASAVDFSGK